MTIGETPRRSSTAKMKAQAIERTAAFKSKQTIDGQVEAMRVHNEPCVYMSKMSSPMMRPYMPPRCCPTTVCAANSPRGCAIAAANNVWSVLLTESMRRLPGGEDTRMTVGSVTFLGTVAKLEKLKS